MCHPPIDIPHPCFHSYLPSQQYLPLQTYPLLPIHIAHSIIPPISPNPHLYQLFPTPSVSYDKHGTEAPS